MVLYTSSHDYHQLWSLLWWKYFLAINDGIPLSCLLSCHVSPFDEIDMMECRWGPPTCTRSALGPAIPAPGPRIPSSLGIGALCPTSCPGIRPSMKMISDASIAHPKQFAIVMLMNDYWFVNDARWREVAVNFTCLLYDQVLFEVTQAISKVPSGLLVQVNLISCGSEDEVLCGIPVNLTGTFESFSS
jgi:hypothetical protein